MRPGTTPIVKIGIPVTLENVVNVRIIFAHFDSVILVKEFPDVTCGEGEVSVRLSQEETLKFNDLHFMKVQVRILYADETSEASDVMECFINELLEDCVIEPGGDSYES